jgi:uncharacterized membrane protein YfcA
MSVPEKAPMPLWRRLLLGALYAFLSCCLGAAGVGVLLLGTCAKAPSIQALALVMLASAAVGVIATLYWLFKGDFGVH